MLDQLLAVEWIKKHVENFVGDSDAITIFGQSAGGVSANLHILSPRSSGLFQRAIMQSGTVSDPDWNPIPPEDAIEYGLCFAEKLGCAKGDVDQVLQCLQSLPVDQIISTDLGLRGNIWMPTVDDEKFMTLILNLFLAMVCSTRMSR